MITLPPKQEAALIAYIVFQNHCDMKTCRKTIAEIIRDHGKYITKIVYRGHKKKDSHIKTSTPFFSVSPDKELGFMFVEHDFSTEKDIPIGHLFKVHLKRVPILDTQDIHYTLSKEVIDEIRKILGSAPIDKARPTYTFEEFLPRLKKTLHELVFEHAGIEWLVLNGGTFYTDASMTEEGYTSKKYPEGYTVHEAWYSFL
jgi:hypothetical protein